MAKSVALEVIFFLGWLPVCLPACLPEYCFLTAGKLTDDNSETSAHFGTLCIIHSLSLLPFRLMIAFRLKVSILGNPLRPSVSDI
jgi:hypothetical protein